MARYILRLRAAAAWIILTFYSVFYAGDSEAGALAEAFGRFPRWTPAMLQGIPSVPGSFRAIARYEIPETTSICDLDDPTQLVALDLRPSDVVSRDYNRTRNWARRIYQQGRWNGVRWWSYYDPRWSSIGLWETAGLTLADVRALRLDDATLAEAALIICRPTAAR